MTVLPYDSFTLPHENANFALQCPDMEYAQIANADHVPQLQRRNETMHLFATFLKDESIQHLDGIIPFSRAQMLEMERRGEERVQIQRPETFLSYRHSDLVIATEVVDLNYFGVLLRFESDLAAVAAKYPRDLALHLSDEEGAFQIECLIFSEDGPHIRALFKHGSFELAERLLRFVGRQKQEQTLLEAVS